MPRAPRSWWRQCSPASCTSCCVRSGCASSGTPCSTPPGCARRWNLHSAAATPAWGRRKSVAGRNDSGVLDHQHHAFVGGARAMHDSLGHRETLPRPQLHDAILQVHKERALQGEEELILVLMLVPVILPLHDPET